MLNVVCAGCNTAAIAEPQRRFSEVFAVIIRTAELLDITFVAHGSERYRNIPRKDQTRDARNATLVSDVSAYGSK